jgi:hypothetical protein
MLFPPDVFTLAFAYFVLVKGLNAPGTRICWAAADFVDFAIIDN